MIRDEHDSKLGALLRYADVLDELAIKRGLLLSSYTGLPLGRCLVLLGSAESQAVKGAVQLQSLIREELVSLSTARAALTLMVKQKWSLTEAFSALSVDCGLVSRNRMGELLIESGMVSQDELELALYVNDHSGLPLGYAIGLLGKSSPGKLKYALTIQRSIRSGSLSRSEGITALEQIKDEALEGDFDRNALFSPLAKLLLKSGIIEQEDLDEVYQRCAETGSMTALDLIDHELISHDLLVATIRIRELVLSGSLTQEAAEKILA
ncbi:MAG: hypothetical protein K2Z81_23655, partial [Cyanobacteria bacterium]|nr:hypothetical protein [Cyanobacteriota bacterium]